jgi:hypothetical protein
MADAAYWVLINTSRELAGCNFLDEKMLRAAGRTHFGEYAVFAGG